MILLVPSQWHFGRPFWTLPPTQEVQMWVWAAAFLGLGVFLAALAAREEGLGIWTVLVTCGVGWAAAYGFLVLRDDVPHSRLIALAGMALGSLLVVLPFLLGRYIAVGVALLAATAAGVAVFGARSVKSDGPIVMEITTELHPLTASFNRVVDSVLVTGGDIVAWRTGFLLVTGDGEFYRLEWDSAGKVLAHHRLAVTAPINLDAFRAEPDTIRGAPWIRVTGLILDTAATPTTIYLAHEYWNTREKCLTIRVSTAPIDVLNASPSAADTWRTVYETRPCLKPEGTFDYYETGGKLAWYQGNKLLLSVGDLGFSGLSGPALSQDSAGDYGKILLLDLAGRATKFTMGHRNTQGLVVGRDGRVWNTEQGPRGGDEINLIERGGNYGWPLVTYGADYGLEYWPLATGKRDHDRFVEPAYTFIPSVAITDISELGSSQFPAWEGDLLAGSLKARSLFRIRRAQGTRVAYVEPIGVGGRVRRG